MAITFPIAGNNTWNYATATRSPSFTLPAAPEENDIIVAFVSSTTTSATTDPANWTNVLGANVVTMPSDSVLACVMVYHRVTAAEAAASTVTWTLTNLWNATEAGRICVEVLRGVATSGELVGTGTSSDPNLVNPALIAAVTPTADNSMILGGVATDGQAAQTTPSGWTRRAGLNTPTQGAYLYARTALGENGVDTGTTNVTVGTADEYASITAAFAEAVAGTTFEMTASGSVTTDGSAAITLTSPVTYSVTASGSTTTDGAAAIVALRALTATGAATTDGTAAILARRALTAAGSVATDGTAAILARQALTAIGSVTTNGTAAIVALQVLTATGSVTTDGSAALRAVLPTSASGAVTTDGSASINIAGGPIDYPLSATGSVTTDGTAAILARRALTATGSVTTNGTAAIVALRVLTATGSVTTDGSASIGLTIGPAIYPITASGSVTTGGSAVLVAVAVLTASGAVVTDGSAAIGQVRQLTASGSVATNGSAQIVLAVIAYLLGATPVSVYLGSVPISLRVG